MDASLLDRLVAEANPWWRTAEWAATDVQLVRAARAPFTYRPSVLANLTRGGLYTLRGPRRVGKSTEIKRAIDALLANEAVARSVVYMSVEGWRSTDPEQLIIHISSVLTGHPGECFWFLDEVTAVEGPWPAVIKRMRDTNLQFAEDTIVISGSSAAQLDEAMKALAGRRGEVPKADRLMLQMPFTAVARALGHQLPTVEPATVGQLTDQVIEHALSVCRPWLPTIIDAWSRYLEVGGYPQAVADYVREGAISVGLLDTLFQIVHGDALAQATLSPTQTAAALRAITRSISSTLDVSSVADAADIAHKTAGERLADLRRSFLAFPVHREQGLAPKPRAQAKWYFTDPLIARLAATRGAGQPPDHPALSEQQLALMLLRSLESTDQSAPSQQDRLLYYRSATRAEIDFVSANFDGTCVESKYVDRGWGRAFQTVQSSPYARGIVATRSGHDRSDLGWALPTGLLAGLLGG